MLINCVAYENGSRLADLPVEEISDYLERPDCFVWVALNDPSPQELDTMKEEFNLHELAVEDGPGLVPGLRRLELRGARRVGDAARAEEPLDLRGDVEELDRLGARPGLHHA